MMPKTLVLVRHGESEGNAAAKAAYHEGDESHYTEEFASSHDRNWSLTELGREQARATGVWLAEHFDGFDRYYVSPYRRTLQTAVALDLPDARWRLNRSLREREFGPLSALSPAKREEAVRQRGGHYDGLYGALPNAESLADVMEHRVRNFLDTLHRECAGQQVLAVSHGYFMFGTKCVLERLADQEIVSLVEQRRFPSNAEAWVYSISDGGRFLDTFQSARPQQVEDGWEVEVGEVTSFELTTYSNADLARLAEL
ncbi:MAG: phosphoglycerate mutase family protein [Aeromicrobium sp.]|uniref:histidine phosphatase family protein n=1 Tax=Aeromicrobium sp. TaxID=1871063 RepID=UPI0039E3547C